MELLAPVGSKESFITAIRAGANAVYMGVPDFNARISATNINLFDLKVLIDHAHQKGVKVFLALNTLVKHEEISILVRNISQIKEFSPDAVIVQDLGVASIIKKYFPELKLHASTQMAVHNRMGVDFLAKQGFERAIMARELTFAELKIIANGAPIGIEVFCHGAICFCVSGMCLVSSFIGGLSGNRGRCTQPCRRLWRNGSKHGYIFSPSDLELAEYVGKLKSIGITSLKIEGRMRSSEYVYKTVKAYRMLIDATASDFEKALAEAKIILSEDAARAKTSCLFSGRSEEVFQPKKAQCLGNMIGNVKEIVKGTLSIEVTQAGAKLAEGDRVRVSNPATDTTIAFKIKEFTIDGPIYTVPFEKAGEFTRGNPVFKTVDSEYDQKNLEKEIDAVYDSYKKVNPRMWSPDNEPTQTYTALISNKWKDIKKEVKSPETQDTLWVRFDDISWLKILRNSTRMDSNMGEIASGRHIGPRKDNPHLSVIASPVFNGVNSAKQSGLNNYRRYVYYLTKENMHYADSIPFSAASAMVGELPPFIGQRDTEIFKRRIDKMAAAGVNKWVLNNVSQFGFFEGMECELTAGQFLYTWNAYTAAFLSELGVKYFTSAWEDEFLNIRKTCGPGLGKFMLVYLFGYAPVVRSRLVTKEMLAPGGVSEYYPGTGPHDSKSALAFLPVFESGLAVLIPERPVNIFTARRKLKECGICNFGIDLSFVKPDKKLWDTLQSYYESGENSPDSLKFNFKRGIK